MHTASKHLNLAEALQQRLRIANLVFTNGTFDLLHAGHVRYLQAARAMGDALFVGLNSDQSIRALKGPKRPLVVEADRVTILSALSCVDAIIVFDELTAQTLIQQLQPEIYVKGADYALTPEQPGTILPEAPLVQQYGGRIALIPLTPGRSSTSLIDRILERYCD